MLFFKIFGCKLLQDVTLFKMKILLHVRAGIKKATCF
jgi:hypothetical protein